MIDLYYWPTPIGWKIMLGSRRMTFEAQLDRSLLQNGRAASSLWLLSGAAFGVGEMDVIVSPSFNFWTVRGGESILMDSHGPRGMERVIRSCEGWLPNAGPGVELPKRITELHRLAEQAGRDPKTISITAFIAPPDPRSSTNREQREP